RERRVGAAVLGPAAAEGGHLAGELDVAGDGEAGVCLAAGLEAGLDGGAGGAGALGVLAAGGEAGAVVGVVDLVDADLAFVGHAQGAELDRDRALVGVVVTDAGEGGPGHAGGDPGDVVDQGPDPLQGGVDLDRVLDP